MNNYKKLLGNSAIFAIGNLGSKLISIILVPLYTYYLSTSDYGMVDIVTTTTSLLLPVITLSMYEAVLRYVMDKNYSNITVLTNSLLITLIGILIIILIYPMLSFFNVLESQLNYMYIILVLQAFQSIFSQFTRAVGEIKKYALNGIIMTIFMGISNITLLVYFNLGIKGYLTSIIISNIISILYLCISTKIYKYVKIDVINIDLSKKMLSYSIPLIPNSLMWWVMNASSRYFILFFVGASANGLFAVANKIPSLLAILNNIFSQAWQLSAIEEYESGKKTDFHSKVFSYFSMTMFIGTSIILVFLKNIMKFLVSSEFYLSWQYVPFLLLGVVFSSFSNFLGANYIAAKTTRGVFKTSMIGGIINIISNIILIQIYGTNGAGLATLISFATIFIIRLYDTKKNMHIQINFKNFTINLVLIFIQISILNLKLSNNIEISIETLLFLLLLVVNKEIFKPMNKLFPKRKRKQR